MKLTEAINSPPYSILTSCCDPTLGAWRPADSVVIRGAAAVAKQARAVPRAVVRPALVNGAAGAVITIGGRPFAVMGFTVSGGKIVEIDAIADPERVRRIAAAVLRDE